MISKKLLLAGVLSGLALNACGPTGPNSANLDNTAVVQSSGNGIIGGRLVQAEEKIIQSIVAVYDMNEGQLCTGSLLPNNIVLTAAHCIGKNPEDMVIFFDTEIGKDSYLLKVDKVEVSPYWGVRRLQPKDTGDIALLHFLGNVPAGYKPATMMSNFDRKLLKKDSWVVLAGFGMANGKTGEGAGTLRMTSVKVEDSQFSVSEIKLNQKEGTGACHGDSGGPAYIEVNGKFILWGITSRGVEDVKQDCSAYAAFTFAPFYNQWIIKTAAKLSRSVLGPHFIK